MRPNRNLLIVAVVVAGLIVAFFATRSNGDEGGSVDAASAENCPPVARMDAAATTPQAPVSVDVLANDTDPDGDPLVFQILKATGGTAVVDDGATPTDASDDRVQFTPAVPAPPAAVVEYQAVDPRGLSATSTIEIAINDLSTLPEGLRSEAVSTDTTGAGRCGTSSPTTGAPTTFVDSTATTFDVSAEDDTTNTTRRRTTTTTKKKSGTTTTAKKNTTTTSGGGSGTTQPTQPTTSTTRPPTTTTQPGNTTTTSDPWRGCGPPPPGGPQSPEWAEWQACYDNNS